MLREVLDEDPHALLPIATVTIGSRVLPHTMAVGRLAVKPCHHIQPDRLSELEDSHHDPTRGAGQSFALLPSTHDYHDGLTGGLQRISWKVLHPCRRLVQHRERHGLGAKRKEEDEGNQGVGGGMLRHDTMKSIG